MQDIYDGPRPYRAINALTVSDGVIVRRSATTGIPERATVTTEPRESATALGVWEVGIRRDGDDHDTELWRTEESHVELDNDLPVAWTDLPTFPGLTVVGEFDFYDGPAEADITGVWRDDTTGQLYRADDWVGDSDVPHEETTREDLVPCTADELEAYLTKRLERAEWMNDRAPYRAEIAQLMARIRSL
ncbi:hypothetical protein ACFYUK_18860 [Nonomuraea wenchangensis]